MVQLRVDVEAARARAEFNATSRSVDGMRGSLATASRVADQLGDELTIATARADQATREFEAAERAADDAADEMNNLRQQVDALGSAAPAALVRQLREAEDAVRAAEREEQRLRDAMEDATQEQHRLNRAFDDGADEVRRITQELALAAAEADRLRRAMDDADRRANRPGRGAQRALLGFRQQIDQAMRAGGGGISGLLRREIERAWAAVPAEARLVVMGAGVAVGVIFAQAAGAAINAALLGAVGGGLLAGVVALAAKSSDAVRGAFSDVFKPIGDQVQAFARDVAEGPLIRAAGIFGQAWKDIGVDVRGAFGDVAKSIEPLATGLAGLVRNVMPGLREGLAAAGPVLDELAAALPDIGRAISEMFRDLSEDGAARGAVKGMRVLAATVIAVFRTIGVVVGGLSRQFDTTTNFIADMLTMLSRLPVVGRLFTDAAATARDFANAGTGAGRSLEQTGAAAEDSATSMYKQATATSKAARAAQELSTKLGDLIETELSVDRAAIAWEAALDAVAAAAKENGRSLDISSEAGQRNAEVLLSGVDAAEANRQAAIKAAGGQDASAASVAAANAKYQQQVDELIRNAIQAGFTRDQVDALLRKYRDFATLPNIDKSITVERKLLGPALGPAFGFRGLASGTKNAPPGWTWVGEKGPELLKFRGGEQVIDAMNSARIAGARSGVAAAEAAAAPSSPARREVIELQLSVAPGGNGAAATFISELVRARVLRLNALNGRVVTA